jgi:uncharacterized protein YcgL (UPF0745 family)
MPIRLCSIVIYFKAKYLNRIRDYVESRDKFSMVTNLLAAIFAVLFVLIAWVPHLNSLIEEVYNANLLLNHIPFHTIFGNDRLNAKIQQEF